VKRRSERVLPSRVQGGLRRAYAHLNSGGELTERFDPGLRAHVQAIYRESNHATAQLLTAHGYHDLPEWLKVCSPA
jgi:hypothetical protein